METPEKNDPVWRLLSHASNTEPGPFFARDVVRSVRLSESEKRSWIDRIAALFQRPTFVTTGAVGAVAVLAILLSLRSPDQGLESIASEDAAFDPAGEFEEIAYLDQLMAVADPAQLDDAALADLFF